MGRQHPRTSNRERERERLGGEGEINITARINIAARDIPCRLFSSNLQIQFVGDAFVLFCLYDAYRYIFEESALIMLCLHTTRGTRYCVNLM